MTSSNILAALVISIAGHIAFAVAAIATIHVVSNQRLRKPPA